MRNKIIIYNGYRYLLYKCQNCHNEMRLPITNNGIVHLSGRCPRCGKDFTVKVEVK